MQQYNWTVDAMNLRDIIPSTTAMLLSLGVAVPALAQTGDPGNEPWAQLQTTSAMIGIGGGSGEGQLILRNLGANCVYPFQVSGFGAGIQVGISRVAAAGSVQGLTRVEDFSGHYSASHGEATILAGEGGTSMRNDANGVTMNLKSNTQGLNIGISGSGMTIAMPIQQVAAPHRYVLEFGFNKDWLNKAHVQQLDQLLAAWKCRYGLIRIIGHADAVGKEDDNLHLAARRAEAVRDYLLNSGLFAGRIKPMTAGEGDQQVPTQQDVRLRANRTVTVTIE